MPAAFNAAADNFQIQLEAAFFCRLGQLWHNNTLTGTFWRLYRNSSDASGVFINGKRRVIHTGKYCLLPPGCDLQTWCDDPETRQLFLHFYLPFLEAKEPFYEIEPDKGLDSLAEQVINTLETEDPAMPLYALALALAAAAKLPADSFTLRPVDFAMEKACAFLRVNLHKSIGVEDMAETVNMDPADFSRRFRHHTGHTPYQYLSHIRYERAERLLRSGKYGIDEICERVGINDRFHFSRCFKKRFGYSPAAYRKMVLEKPAIFAATGDLA